MLSLVFPYKLLYYYVNRVNRISQTPLYIPLDPSYFKIRSFRSHFTAVCYHLDTHFDSHWSGNKVLLGQNFVISTAKL